VRRDEGVSVCRGIRRDGECWCGAGKRCWRAGDGVEGNATNAEPVSLGNHDVAGEIRGETGGSKKLSSGGGAAVTEVAGRAVAGHGGDDAGEGIDTPYA